MAKRYRKMAAKRIDVRARNGCKVAQREAVARSPGLWWVSALNGVGGSQD